MQWNDNQTTLIEGSLPIAPNHRHQQLQLSVGSPFVAPKAKDGSSVTHNRCASDIVP
jgi:hypothetical protein